MDEYTINRAMESGEYTGISGKYWYSMVSEYNDYLDEYFWPEIDKDEVLKSKLFNFLMAKNNLDETDKIDEYNIKDLYESCKRVDYSYEAVKEIDELLDEENACYTSNLDL